MTRTVWQSTVTYLGTDAAMMFDAGVYILFGEPVPATVAEVSLVHNGSADPFTPLLVGDVFRLSDSAVTITEVGRLANTNFEELGHIVLYLNVPDAELLPGAVKATGSLTPPAIGDPIVITRSA